MVQVICYSLSDVTLAYLDILGMNRAAIEYNADMDRLDRHAPGPLLWRIRLLWCCILVVGLLATCATEPNTGANSSPTPAPHAPQSTTLTIWHSWHGAHQDALNALARTYEQANPNVRIRLESQPAATLLRSFQARVADDSAPQVLITSGRYIGELAERQYLMPLDASAYDLSELLPATRDGGLAGDQLYGVPLRFDALVLFYDRRAYAETPTSFEQLTATPSTSPVTDTEQWSLGYYLSLERTLPYLPAFGGALFDQDGAPVFATASRDATIRWLAWLRDLHADPTVRATPDFSMLDADIQQGRIAAVVDWTSKRADYEQLWGPDAVGIAPLPSIDAGEPQTMVSTEVACINAVTSPEQRATAEDFLRFSLGPSAQSLLVEQSRGALLPVQQDVSVNDQGEAIRQAIGSAQPFNSQLAARNVWQALDDMVRSVVLNANNPADAVDAAAHAMQQ